MAASANRIAELGCLKDQFVAPANLQRATKLTFSHRSKLNRQSWARRDSPNSALNNPHTPKQRARSVQRVTDWPPACQRARYEGERFVLPTRYLLCQFKHVDRAGANDDGWTGSLLAERVGFEPDEAYDLYTLSRRAPSTARPSLQSLRRKYIGRLQTKNKPAIAALITASPLTVRESQGSPASIHPA